MKKILYLSLALAVAMLAGCKKDDTRTGTRGSIGLHPSTNRAFAGQSDVVDISALQADGFNVWATTADNSTDWALGIDGIKHEYNDGDWSFTPAVGWPTDAAAWPMMFHAMYPSPAVIEATAGSAVNDTPQNLSVDFTVADDVADQFDFIGAHATATQQPNNDQLSVVFHHLLTKVDFSFTVPDTETVYLRSLGVENVSHEGVFDFIDGDWTGWNPVYDARYDYFNTTVPKVMTDVTNVPLYGVLHDNHLMLMPQNAPDREWDVTAAPSADQNHVSMLYRMASGADTDYLGYAEAQDHPAFATAGGSTPATSPLYVRVGFPFTLDWESGRGYTYNISLNSRNGGYLVDQNYYDADGDRTALLVGDKNGDGVVDPAQPTVPDRVLGGDSYIHLHPSVSGWDDVTPGL